MADTAATRIPEEWRDPRLVLPHLADQLTGWTGRLYQVEQDLAVVQGALDPGEHLSAIEAEKRRAQVLEWITAIRARVDELHHQVAGRTTAFRLIGDELTRESGS